MKILLVDDDRTMLAVLTALLQLEDYEVITNNGKSSSSIMDQVNAETPDVVLMDVNLHDCSGMDVLHAIKQDPRLKGIKVLMTSGMSVKEECDASGADGFLLKPYMPDELSSLIKSFL